MTITHIEWSELRSSGFQNARVTLSASVAPDSDIPAAFAELADVAKAALDAHAPKPNRKAKKPKTDEMTVEVSTQIEGEPVPPDDYSDDPFAHE